MSLPSPLLQVPALTGVQLSFQGVTLGTGTPFGLTQIEGLDKPDVRSGNTDRPRTRGAFVGYNELKTRTPTLTLDIGPFAEGYGSYRTLPGALAALTQACATEGDVEYPLWIQLPGLPQVCCMARVLKKNVPYDVTANLGGLIKGASLQFEATDSYLYAAPTQSATLSLPTPGTGFTFPITFPLSFGGGSGGNQLIAANDGDVSCWPVIVINGPCLVPSLTNLTTPGSPTITLDIELFAGDQLVIDCDMESIVYFPAGQTIGAPYPEVLQAGSTFFAITPGDNAIEFNSMDLTAAVGTAELWWTSAYSGVL